MGMHMIISQNCLYMSFNICHFRPDEEQKPFGRKKKKIDNTQPIEELFENNISKIMKDNAGKSVRMLLPIKTKNGFIEERIIEEQNEISNEDENSSNNNEEESKENDKEDNSDMEMEVDVHVRLKLRLQYFEDFYSCVIYYIIY